MAVAAARAAAAKQGSDIVILDVRDLIGITDYFLIAGGSTDRQVRALAEEIERVLKSEGQRPVRREGEREGQWVLLDYVDLVAHLFRDEERTYYDLERLWADAPRVDWEAPAAKSG
jgi:ribosome-associated protein